MKDLNKFITEATADELKISLNVNELIEKLQVALAEEFNQWYMYTIVRPYLVGHERKHIVELYDIQAKDELEDHAYWLMERISQLGGKPDRVLTPTEWDNTAAHKYITPDLNFDVVANIKQNIESEKGAIETYSELVAFTENRDPVTNAKMKEILADEQEHLQDLEDYLADLGKK